MVVVVAGVSVFSSLGFSAVISWYAFERIAFARHYGTRLPHEFKKLLAIWVWFIRSFVSIGHILRKFLSLRADNANSQACVQGAKALPLMPKAPHLPRRWKSETRAKRKRVPARPGQVRNQDSEGDRRKAHVHRPRHLLTIFLRHTRPGCRSPLRTITRGGLLYERVSKTQREPRF